MKYALQWGRDQLIAELPPIFSGASAMSLLQWGRDQLIAEFVAVQCAPDARIRFNGAAIN